MKIIYWVLLICCMTWAEQSERSMSIKAQEWNSLDQTAGHGSYQLKWTIQVPSTGSWCYIFSDMVDSLETVILDPQSKVLRFDRIRHQEMNNSHYIRLFSEQCFDAQKGVPYTLIQKRWSSHNQLKFITLREKSTLLGQGKIVYLWINLYFGMIVTFILLHIVLGGIFRKGVHLYYALFLVSYILASIVYANRSTSIFGPWGELGNLIIPFLAGLCCLSISLFTSSYFDLKRNHPKLNGVLLGSAWLLLAMGIFETALPGRGIFCPNLDHFVYFLILNILVGVWMRVQKFPYANWYLYSWGFCFLGFLVLLLDRNLNLFPSELMVEMFAPCVAHILEMTLFTSVLVKQIADQKKATLETYATRRRAHSQILEHAIHTLPEQFAEIPRTLEGLSPADQQIWQDCLYRLQQVQDNLKVYALLETQKFMDQSVVPLDQVLNQFIAELSYDKKTDLRMRVKLEQQVDVPGFALQFVLTSLADNACKFGEKKPYQIHLDQENQNLVLSVVDQGPGFDTQFSWSAKGAFWQSRQDLQRQFQGLGLGLSLVRRILELYGAQIVFENRPVGGAKVQVFWPVEWKQEPWQEWHYAPSSSPKLESVVDEVLESADTRPVLLVVDDNPINRKMLAKMALKLNFDTIEASQGQEALDLFYSHQFAAILMDLQMPVMDGFEATRQWRLLEASLDQQTPILAVTAHDQEGTRAECMAAGFQDLLSKPFTIEQLRHALVQQGALEN